jgi:anti-sigma regulatory factor (Ser/Thr protein kinase)
MPKRDWTPRKGTRGRSVSRIRGPRYRHRAPSASCANGGDTVEKVAAVPAIRISLPRTAESPAEARHLVSRFAAENDLRSESDAALLVLSELVTNAVLHGAEPIEVYVCRDGDLLRIEVSDGGAPTDGVAPRSQDDQRPGGRGLHIVNSLARRWGTTDNRGGKTVWAEIGLIGRTA